MKWTSPAPPRADSACEYLGTLHSSPVATSLLTIGLALAGMLAFFLLPVSPMRMSTSPSSWSPPRCRSQSRDVATASRPRSNAPGHYCRVTEMPRRAQSATPASRCSLNSAATSTARTPMSRRPSRSAVDLRPRFAVTPPIAQINPADAPAADPRADLRNLDRWPDLRLRIHDHAAELLQYRASAMLTIGGGSLPAGGVATSIPAALCPNMIASRMFAAALSPECQQSERRVQREWPALPDYVNDTKHAGCEYQTLIVAYRTMPAVA